MNLRMVVALIGMSVLSVQASKACTDGVNGIFPKNNMNIPVSRFSPFTIEKAIFDSAIDKAIEIYTPIFAQKGLKFEVERRWDDGTVNAMATRSGDTAVVHMYGGLARHPLVTADAFAMVICHEMGHHLGGAPKTKQLWWDTWASDEGQSDYFATLKCSREIWKDADNIAAVSAMKVDPAAQSGCEKAWHSASEIALCVRASMAGKSLADTLADLGKKGPTDFLTPDTSKVSKTNHAHPMAQCRLDTYFAGALCTVSKDEALNDKDSTLGVCASEKGMKDGSRPLCWYKPVL